MRGAAPPAAPGVGGRRPGCAGRGEGELIRKLSSPPPQHPCGRHSAHPPQTHPALPGCQGRKPGGAGSGLRWGRGAPPSPPARVPVFKTNRSHGANPSPGRASSCGWPAGGSGPLQVAALGTAGPWPGERGGIWGRGGWGREMRNGDCQSCGLDLGGLSTAPPSPRCSPGPKKGQGPAVAGSAQLGHSPCREELGEGRRPAGGWGPHKPCLEEQAPVSGR